MATSPSETSRQRDTSGKQREPRSSKRSKRRVLPCLLDLYSYLRNTTLGENPATKQLSNHVPRKTPRRRRPLQPPGILALPRILGRTMAGGRYRPPSVPPAVNPARG